MFSASGFVCFFGGGGGVAKTIYVGPFNIIFYYISLKMRSPQAADEIIAKQISR